MQQIDEADKQIGDADGDQIRVVNVADGTPGDDEDRRGDDDTDHLNNAVKQQIIDVCGQVETDQARNYKDSVKEATAESGRG